MLKGIHLTLMIGPAVPIPAPQSVIDALTGVQVTSGRDRSGFQLTFAVSKRSPLLRTMLPAGYFDPMVTRVIVIVTLGGMPNVLMDGIVTRQELQPSSEPGQSTLTITGEDLSVLMDVIQKIIPYPAMPEIAQIYSALAPYAMFGVVPVAIPPIISALRIPTSGFDSQLHTTDLQFIKGRASECGYVFTWSRVRCPRRASPTSGPTSAYRFRSRRLTSTWTRTPMSSRSAFRWTAGQEGADLHDQRSDHAQDSNSDSRAQRQRLQASAGPAPHASGEGRVRGRRGADEPSRGGATDPRLLHEQFGGHQRQRHAGCTALRTRAAVAHAGGRAWRLAYDGLYYVNSVTHNLKRGEYKQSFSLSRDGLISNTPRLVA